MWDKWALRLPDMNGQGTTSFQLRDAGLALLLVLFSLFTPLGSRFTVFDAVLIACAAAAPFTRRRWPLLTVAVSTAVLAVCAFAPDVRTGVISVCVFTAYVSARHLPALQRYIAVAALLFGDIVATALVVPALTAVPFEQRAIPIAWSVTLLILGVLLGELRRRSEESAERELQLQLERQREEFERASAEQRAHLAREIHDIVTHSLTVIVAQADGARYGSSPDEALATISSVGRESLRQMRGVVGLLRGAESRPVEPLIADLDIGELVGTSRAAGLNIDYAVTGEQPADLAPGTILTIHRIVQEALTNALKHGNGDADLTVAWHPTSVAIRVVNGISPATADSVERGIGSGHGLHGIRERAALIDGSVTASLTHDHRWVTEAQLPLTETSGVHP